MPKRRGVFAHSKTLVFLIIFLLAANLSAVFSPARAVHQQNAPAAGSPPAPQPCQNPEVAEDDQLTDNFITDSEGDPPGDEIDEGLTNNNPNALKFTATRTGQMGTLVSPAIHKDMTFDVNFSRLQAIFGATNSNYSEGSFQSQLHATTNIIGLPSGKMQSFQGVLQKTAPKVMTDALRENYIKYVWEKPELAESAMKFSDYQNTAGSEKTVHQLVTEFGGAPPQAPSATEDKTQWNATWGKYWEKIPTAYDEFYIGKLEFRAYLGQPTIAKLKSGEPGYCNNFTLLRTVEFPVPRFFRTAQTTGILNQMMLPKVAQNHQNNLIDIKGNVAGATNSVASFAQYCFSVATNNPISKVIKKVVKVSMETTQVPRNALASALSNPLKNALDYAAENLNPAQPAYAVNRATNVNVNQTGCGPNNQVSATVTWTRADDPSGGLPISDQEIQVSLASNFSNSFTQTFNLSSGATSRTFTDFFLPNTDYWIRINTEYNYFTGTSWSNGDVRSIHTINCVVATPTCTLSTNSAAPNGQVIVRSQNGAFGTIGMQAGINIYGGLGTLPSNGQTTITIPSSAPSGTYTVRVANGTIAIDCTPGLTVLAPTCSISPTSIAPGGQITIRSQNGAAGEVRMLAAFAPPGTVSTFLANIAANSNVTVTIPSSFGQGLYAIRIGNPGSFIVYNCGDLSITPPAPTCTINAPTTLYPGDIFGINSINSLEGPIQIAGAFWDPDPSSPNYKPSVNIGTLVANTTVDTLPIPNSFDPGLYAVRVGLFAVDCGTVNIGEWTLTTPTFSYGNSVNFAISPTPNNRGGQMKLKIFRTVPGTTVQNIQANTCFPSSTQVYEGDVTSTSVAWPPTQVIKGEFFAVLAKGVDYVSTSECFQTRFELKAVVTGRNVVFTIAPPVHINPSALSAVAIIVTNTDSNQDVADSGGLSTNTTTYPTPPNVMRLAPANYRACLSNLAFGVWDGDQLSPPLHACTTFNISNLWPWVSAPLEDDSCIKVFGEGKSGNAPYCAIYNTKFDPPSTNAFDQVNVIPGECPTPTTDQYKLNDQTNVICKFSFALDSNIMEVDQNPSSLKLPTDSDGNGTIDASELGPWDECSNPDGGGNITCDITINVWPNFRIPFLSQAWNNTLYADAKESLSTLQQTNTPGVYTFAQPKVATEISQQDPLAAQLQAMVDACKADPPTTTEPGLQGCADIAAWAASSASDAYPAPKQCITANLLNPTALVDCLNFTITGIISDLKKLPGQVNSQINSAVQGINTSGGQVLGSNDGQKIRFVGAVECGKHLTRDIMLKPKVLQQYLAEKTNRKVEFNCDLNASTDATNPQTPPSGTPPPGGDPGDPGEPPADCNPISDGNSANGIETGRDELVCFILRNTAGMTEAKTGLPLGPVMIQVMDAESSGDQCAFAAAGEIGVFQYIAATWKSVQGSLHPNIDSGTVSPPNGSACWGIPGIDPVATTSDAGCPGCFSWPSHFGGTYDGLAWDPYLQIRATITEMRNSGGCPWSTFKAQHPGVCP